MIDKESITYYTFEVGRKGYIPSNELVWNVLRNDLNTKEIKVYNIFNHVSFYKTCVKAKKFSTFEEFAESIRSNLMYYFWSKYEYEIIITSFPPREDVEEKIDVYDQVMLNWDNFINYLWNNQSKLKKGEVCKIIKR